MTGPADSCPNCRRPLTSRACADPDHRAARGEAPPGPATRECPNPDHRGPRALPVSAFWSRHDRVLRKSCNACRRRARIQRNLPKRGAAARQRAATDHFWNEQAASHN